MENTKTIIVWLRNDLRLRDNEALWRATQDADYVIPLYIFDPFWYGKTSFGFPKTGSFRAQFIRESVEALQRSLRGLGADLIVRSGDTATVLAELAAQFSADAVYFHTEVTSEETRMEQRLEKLLQGQKTSLKRFWGHTLFHIDDLPFSPDDIPQIFTAFRKSVEKESDVRDEFPAVTRLKLPPGIKSETIPGLEHWGLKRPQEDERAAYHFRGGEQAAWQRVEEYFWAHDSLKDYKNRRNELLGEDYSSKLSPWLATGAISARSVFYEIIRYEDLRHKNISTYWLIFELIWRDFFRFTARQYGDRLFALSGIAGKKEDWRHDREQFERWANGTTGFPFVDANMRELKKSGYMSNRGRQNVASFLSHNLHIDWRMGAEYFESLLIDYDVCSNWGNWAYVAGVGNDPRSRYFDIIKQAYEYDPHSTYVRRWLPELQQVPNGGAQEVWRLAPEMLDKCGVVLGETYPRPMINLDESYAQIRRRMYEEENG